LVFRAAGDEFPLSCSVYEGNIRLCGGKCKWEEGNCRLPISDCATLEFYGFPVTSTTPRFTERLFAATSAVINPLSTSAFFCASFHPVNHFASACSRFMDTIDF